LSIEASFYVSPLARSNDILQILSGKLQWVAVTACAHALFQIATPDLRLHAT
jgi:hypothetical protein